MNKCIFDEAWRGPCYSDCAERFCEKHAGLRCVSCGAQATRECDETHQFICGYPLCNDCEHTIAEDGTNGGIAASHHCKKGEQKHLPWYVQEGPQLLPAPDGGEGAR